MPLIIAAGFARLEAAVPIPDHVVIVIEENHAFSQIYGSTAAPYINSLASQGAVFAQSFAITHPSQPNYLAFFSGSTQGVANDNTPHSFTTPNLGAALIARGLSFGGYSEDLPAVGSLIGSSGAYRRKHNPWSNWQGAATNGIPAADNLPFTSFPSDYTLLPKVTIVVPNLNDDMHDGTIDQGDAWLRNRLDGYVQWAKTHNSLLILTWDEDDSTASNQILTILVGANVRVGTYNEHINHYNTLRTIEEMYGLTHSGNAATATAISDCWNDSSLPNGWSTQDVGTVAAIGGATEAGGNWRVWGSGADIWNDADEFHYVWQLVSGDVRITAQVTSLTYTTAWAKAGVMVRESLAAGSRHAFTCVTPAHGVNVQRRLTTNGASRSTSGPLRAAPYWVRVERIGDVLIGSSSPDGTTWTEMHRETMIMGTSVHVGMAVTSRVDGTLATATFGNVQITTAATAVN